MPKRRSSKGLYKVRLIIGCKSQRVALTNGDGQQGAENLTSDDRKVSGEQSGKITATDQISFGRRVTGRSGTHTGIELELILVTNVA